MSSVNKKVKEFIKKHKIKLLIVGSIVIAIGFGYLGFKYIPKIKTKRTPTISASNTPMKLDTLNLGGILTNICIWSGHEGAYVSFFFWHPMGFEGRGKIYRGHFFYTTLYLEWDGSSLCSIPTY